MNNSLKEHNTFGLDVKCRRFIEYTSLNELSDIQKNLEKPYLHIGQGSNLLFTGDYEGTILHCGMKGIRKSHEDNDNVFIEVAGGEIWDDVVAWCVEHGYNGTENLSLIPGEMGAAAVQNIGAYGAEIKDVVEYVDAFDLTTGNTRRFENTECQYAYRSSIFKSECKGQYAIYSVTLKLNKIFIPHLEYGGLKSKINGNGLDAKQLRQTIIDIRNAKLPDPKVIGNAGSFFMNPVVSKDFFDTFILSYPEAPHYAATMKDADGNITEGVKIPAGWLIEQCGWKGKTFGKAGVYEKQALVLVNLGGADSKDIISLCKAIQHDVKVKFNIDIQPEVNMI